MNHILERLAGLIKYAIYGSANPVGYLRSLGVRIGDDCELLNLPGDYGSEPWLVEIGNHVTITSGVKLITHDASSRLFRKDLPDSSPYGNRFGTIIIMDNCFIGTNSIILPDVRIGPNSIVGAGSVVTKSVPPKSVVAGVPARKIANLDDYIARYRQKMVPIRAKNRKELRVELTRHFWGNIR